MDDKVYRETVTGRGRSHKPTTQGVDLLGWALMGDHGNRITTRSVEDQETCRVCSGFAAARSTALHAGPKTDGLVPSGGDLLHGDRHRDAGALDRYRASQRDGVPLAMLSPIVCRSTGAVPSASRGRSHQFQAKGLPTAH